MARHSLQAYPRAKVDFLSSANSHMRMFKEVPLMNPLAYQLLVCLPLLGFLCLGLALVSLPQFRTGWAGGVITVGSILIGTASSFLSVRYLARMLSNRQRRLDERTLPHRDEARHVGVAYCDDVRYFQWESSWDRGYIDLERGMLRFRGHVSRFALPVTSIQNVEIKRHSQPFGPNLLRVYVQWESPTGTLEVFSLEVREDLSVGAPRKRVEELASWIRSGNSAQENADDPVWPLQSSELNLTPAVDYERLSLWDHIYAGVLAGAIAGIPLGFLSVLVFKLFHWHMPSWSVSAFAPFYFLAWGYFLTRRAKAKQGQCVEENTRYCA